MESAEKAYHYLNIEFIAYRLRLIYITSLISLIGIIGITATSMMWQIMFIDCTEYVHVNLNFRLYSIFQRF